MKILNIITIGLLVCSLGVEGAELSEGTESAIAGIEEKIGSLQGMELRIVYMAAFEAGAAEDLLIVIKQFSEETLDALGSLFLQTLFQGIADMGGHVAEVG